MLNREKKKPGRNRPITEAPPRRVMDAKEMAKKVQNLTAPALATWGLELICAECAPEPGGILLRLYVDKEGGVTVDDCAKANRQVRDICEAVLESGLPCRLEVSSPGEDRPLTQESHFNRFSGHRAVIRISKPLNGRRKFTGVLMGFSEGVVTIMVDGNPIAIPWESISSARLQHAHGEDPC